MGNSIRYGDFLKESQVNYHEISYNTLTPKENQPSSKKIKLRSLDIYRLVKPYVSVRFFEQLYALLPLVLYLVFFQLFILRQDIADALSITIGLSAVIIGLMLFMEGLKQGLMPFGEVIGNTLPKKVSLFTVLFISFLLGIGVTFAEPAIGALKAAGSLVEPERAPYLYALLNFYSTHLVLVVGAGVGLAAVLGTMRFVYGWSLKPYIYIALIPTIGLTLYIMNDPLLASTIGLAWDSGAVTTGPVTVPLVLALGIGIAGAAGKGNSSLSGFGIVTLASIFPIIAVLVLSIIVSFSITPEEILSMAKSSNLAGTPLPWFDTSPFLEVILGIRAIVPLVLFLFVILLFVLKERLKHAGTIAYGLVLAVVGMCVFNIGLTYGLSALGGQSGSLIPLAFNPIEIDGQVVEPLYHYTLGLVVALLFAFVLGFGATLAEPALNALGLTVQDLTQGAFKKSMLMYAVSFGVGLGIMLGVIKIIFDLSLGYMLIPLYALAVILTYFSTEEFVNIAWDSAGVTTGPITVPLVLAMGLGFGNSLDRIDGFGILSMASIMPILSVLTMGLYVNYKIKHQKEEADA